MPDQNNTTTSENYRYPALPADLAEAFGHRPLTAKEVTQWLADCVRQAESPEKLRGMGEHATGILRAMLLCWVIGIVDHDAVAAELNAIYEDRHRELVRVSLH